ncbi:hypothetical protein [Silvibacterium acidisoli]|uniref:hypothetical protein n=1 Tax=Acidobacteriaceae bacterium ZG23-2 TaxID=2883246 RepID=UPI00406D040B
MLKTPITVLSEVGRVSDEEAQQQVERIVHSNSLRGSSTLQQLLRYLVSRYLEGSTDFLKEYTIGLEAFGRKPDFDPRTDTIVRVQTHRLRQKLRDFYGQEGIHDRILIEIPKGQYGPVIRLKDEAESPKPESSEAVVREDPNATAPADEVDTTVNVDQQLPRKTTLLKSAVLALLLAAALISGFFLGSVRSKSSATGIGIASANSVDPVKKFWAAFLQGDRAPIIAYPNAVFLLDDSNDLLRFRQGASDSRGARVEEHLAQQFASNPALVKDAGALYYEDGYTGTGELQGVAALAQLFAEMGLKPIIKTSRNVTPEDLQEHSVILLGSPFQNVAVGQLFAEGDFAFDNPDSHREQWRAVILNAHPQKGESATYHTERDAKTQVLKVDYSLISIQPGVVQGHRIAVLGGLDTKGTEGVTRFMATADGIQALTAALAAKGISLTGEMPYFQALVRVQLEKGDMVLKTDLTAIHPLPHSK